jgi:hypothetical protein
MNTSILASAPFFIIAIIIQTQCIDQSTSSLKLIKINQQQNSIDKADLNSLKKLILANKKTTSNKTRMIRSSSTTTTTITSTTTIDSTTSTIRSNIHTIEDDYRENFVRLIENFLIRHLKKILLTQSNEKIESSSTRLPLLTTSLINLTTSRELETFYDYNIDEKTSAIINTTKSIYSYTSTLPVKIDQKFGKCNLSSIEAIIDCEKSNNNKSILSLSQAQIKDNIITTIAFIPPKTTILTKIISNRTQKQRNNTKSTLFFNNRNITASDSEQQYEFRTEIHKIVNYYKSYFIYFVSIIIFLTTVCIFLLIVAFISCAINCKQRERLNNYNENECFTYYNKHLPIISSVSSFSLTSVTPKNKKRRINYTGKIKLSKASKYVNSENYIPTYTSTNNLINPIKNCLDSSSSSVQSSESGAGDSSNDSIIYDHLSKSHKVSALIAAADYCSTNDADQVVSSKTNNVTLNTTTNISHAEPINTNNKISELKSTKNDIDENEKAINKLMENCSKYLFYSNLDINQEKKQANKNKSVSSQDDLDNRNNYIVNNYGPFFQDEEYFFGINTNNSNNNLMNTTGKNSNNFIRDRYYQILREQVFPFLNNSYTQNNYIQSHQLQQHVFYSDDLINNGINNELHRPIVAIPNFNSISRLNDNFTNDVLY